MAKRELKKYLTGLTKEQLEEQFVLLYEKFPEVKTYYNFVFNPQEGKLADQAKVKIANEYFPSKGKRAKLRRSVAQKFIRHFITLGVDPLVTADVMLFAIETAQKFSASRYPRYASFYGSTLTAYKQAVDFSIRNGILGEMRARLAVIPDVARAQNWENHWDFATVWSRVD